MTIKYKHFPLLCFFLFIGINTIVYGQESAVFIKSTMYPFKGWNGSHGGNHTISIGSNIVTKSSNTSNEVEIEYDFLYISDSEDPNYINCKGSTSGNYNGDCNIGKYPNPPYNISYNKLNFDEGYFEGCIGESEIYGIHLPQPSDNQRCINELINLELGWNWQYSYDDINWINFSSEFQEKRLITFKINELASYTGKSNIYFRTGYGIQFTKSIKYDIIGCSPALNGNPIPSKVKCNGQASGSVTLKFQTNIKPNQQLLLNLFEGTIFRQHKFAQYSDIINNEFPWKDLAEGTYTIKYQAQSNTDMNTTVGSSPVITPSFKIGSPELLKFTATPIQPLCSTDKGSIEITVIGGTAPYYYILDNATENINGQDVPIKTPISVPVKELTEGNHNIKVVDWNECIQTQE